MHSFIHGKYVNFWANKNEQIKIDYVKNLKKITFATHVAINAVANI